MYIHDVLDIAMERGASDIHITVGLPPMLRIDGELEPIGDTSSLDSEDTKRIVQSVSPDRHMKSLEEAGSADFAYEYVDENRFRVATFKHQKNMGMVMRHIPNHIFGFDDLGLPATLKDLCAQPRGLILVTGPTGSGKTTTLATFIDYINETYPYHIVTIEDPIEFRFEHKQSVITQREKGVDVLSFSDGLRSALRMDPDVMLVGEMRDRETIGAAITAAETGHLVFGTLHTNSASQTINRIIDTFPKEEQAQVRSQLSVTLSAVVSQTLCPRKDESGRIAAFEVMLATSGIRNLIRERKEQNIPSAIQTGGSMGMQTMDQHLKELYQYGKISYDEAVARAQNPKELKKEL